MAIRVVVGEDNYLVREGIERLLATRDGIEVIGSAGDFGCLSGLIERRDDIDVVVADIGMPPGGAEGGIRLAESLRDRHPEIGVVVLSERANATLAVALLQRGTHRRAYLLKEHVHTIEDLEQAIQAVAAGGSMIDAQVVDELIVSRTTRSQLDALTRREREILAHMARGENNGAIAANLMIADNSVEKYVSSIFHKLGLTWEHDVHRRVKAVLLYLAETAR